MSYMTETVFEPWHPNAEVTLAQMLDAREMRFFRQRELIDAYHKPLVSFSMNIAGSIKQSRATARAFALGCRALENMIGVSSGKLICRDCASSRTGDLAFYVVDMPARDLKSLCVSLENSHPLGRLFDIDVIDENMQPISRRDIGQSERGCMICGKPGKACAAGRVHSAQQLQERTAKLLYNYFLESDSTDIMAMAAKALRFEAWTTPKPGLVDMNNNGIHKDMDLTTLMSSVSVIAPFFRSFFLIGVESSRKLPEQSFALLRAEGLKAEQEMFQATGGVNTHKGAIFLLGLLCGACGRRWHPGGLFTDVQAIFRDCAIMAGDSLQRELDALSAEQAATYGEQLYLRRKSRGARGTVIDGFKEVNRFSLPILRRGFELGKGILPSGRSALLHLIANVDDSNMLHRNSPQLRSQVCEKLSCILKSNPFPAEEAVEAMDREFIRLGLSPGGCADLLAVTYFVFFLENPDFE